MIILEFDILLICPMTIQLMSILILNLVVDAGAETAADEFVEDLVGEEDQEDEDEHQPGQHQEREGCQVQHLVTVVRLKLILPLDLIVIN